MIKLEIYNKEKTYMYPTGGMATPESVKKNYPATQYFDFVVTTNEAAEVIYGLDPLNSLRSHHNIDSSLSTEEALAAIEEILNTPQEEPEAEITAEERIAACMEYQVMSSMEDVAEEETVVE